MCSFLYKSIEYSDEKHIKNVNLYRTIKFNAKQMYMAYKAAIIRLVFTFIIFEMVVSTYAGVEIALDIYDQLCLDQGDQDKRELKDYMERRFLNQK